MWLLIYFFFYFYDMFWWIGLVNIIDVIVVRSIVEFDMVGELDYDMYRLKFCIIIGIENNCSIWGVGWG